MLLDGWIEEIEKYSPRTRTIEKQSLISWRHVSPGILSLYKYHGPKRMLQLSSSVPYNIVFSTYGTVAADFSRGGGVLDQIHWYRLILDEGIYPTFVTTPTF